MTIDTICSVVALCICVKVTSHTVYHTFSWRHIYLWDNPSKPISLFRLACKSSLVTFLPLVLYQNTRGEVLGVAGSNPVVDTAFHGEKTGGGGRHREILKLTVLRTRYPPQNNIHPPPPPQYSLKPHPSRMVPGKGATFARGMLHVGAMPGSHNVCIITQKI